MTPVPAGTVADIVDAGRRSVAAGLAVGSGGNLSARLPGAGAVVITAAGAWLDALQADDLVVVALDGRAVAGTTAPSTELALHLHAYRARPDVTAVVHLHPQVSVLLDALDHEIRLFTTDHLAYVRRVGRVPFVPPGTDEIARAVADQLRAGFDCVLLANHGCTVVGDSIPTALRRVLNLEQAAVATLRALQTGDTATRGPEEYERHLGRLPSGGH